VPNGQWPVLYNQVCGCNREALWLTALLRPRDERGVRMTCSTIVWGMLWGMGEHANYLRVCDPSVFSVYMYLHT